MAERLTRSSAPEVCLPDAAKRAAFASRALCWCAPACAQVGESSPPRVVAIVFQRCAYAYIFFNDFSVFLHVCMRHNFLYPASVGTAWDLADCHGEKGIGLMR